jgi:DNA-binding XRE family transcriptional regulator
LAPAIRASSLVNSCALPAACAIFPPLLDRTDRCSGVRVAKPRGLRADVSCSAMIVTSPRTLPEALDVSIRIAYNIDMTKLQTMVRSYRKRAGLSQKALAKRLGCSQPTLHRIEHGEQGAEAFEKRILKVCA